ncbi:MAG: hypothetical protein KDD33_05115 [Bdellovibrionales bacterium]|nr:hypothetical protein [Bdellovibrionales bacterium]
MNKDEKLKIHTDTSSDLPGLWGLSERVLRRFKGLAFFLTLLPLVFIYIFCLAVALSPGVFLFEFIGPYLTDAPMWMAVMAYSLAIAISYVMFGVTLVFVVPLMNFLIPFKVKECRGNWYSLQVIPWYYHNALTQLVRYTVLDMMTPTPVTMMFYKMMGMKMGKNCIINTTNISDPCLIELGDYVTIGGSATIFAHYGQGGYLIIGRTKIGDYSTVGLKASIMGNVTVGKKCMIHPHAVLLPKTHVADGETV